MSAIHLTPARPDPAGDRECERAGPTHTRTEPFPITPLPPPSARASPGDPI